MNGQQPNTMRRLIVFMPASLVATIQELVDASPLPTTRSRVIRELVLEALSARAPRDAGSDIRAAWRRLLQKVTRSLPDCSDQVPPDTPLVCVGRLDEELVSRARKMGILPYPDGTAGQRSCSCRCPARRPAVSGGDDELC